MADFNSNALFKLFGGVPPFSEDDIIAKAAAAQTQQNQQATGSINKMLPPPDVGRVPMFAGQPALAGPDNNIGRFANPNLSQLPPATFDDFLVNTIEGPPGQSFEDNPEQGKEALSQIFSNAKQNLGNIARLPYDAYKGIEKLMTTPVRDESGKLTGDIIDQSTKTAGNLFGLGMLRAAGVRSALGTSELGAAGSQIGQKRPLLSVEQEARLGEITNSVQGGWGHSKRVVNEFRKEFPDFKGSDHTIERYMRKSGTRDHRTELTPEMKQTFDTLHRQYHNTNQAAKSWQERMTAKEVLKKFYAQHPDYKGSFDGLRTKLGRTPKNMSTPDDGFELGSFGGKRPEPKLNTPAYGESINWLQSKRPVDEEWVLNWAKEAGVPVRKVRTTGRDIKNTGQSQYAYPTKYIELQNNLQRNTKETTHPRVRIPTDPERHIGTHIKPHELGNMIDTGTGSLIPREIPGFEYRIPKLAEYTTTNKAGMSYADPTAADAWLKWRFSKAPNEGNWLIPEDMAPRMPVKGPSHTPPSKPYIDPNQKVLGLRGHHPDSLRPGRKPTLSLKLSKAEQDQVDEIIKGITNGQ